MKIKITFFLFFIVLTKNLSSQNPVLKVYLDAKELTGANTSILAFVKANSKYYPILDHSGKKIILPEEVEYHTIQSFKFIINTDTIVFSVGKILEDLKNSPEKNMVDELNTIFKEIAKWELHIDHFKYANEKELITAAKDGPRKNTVYKDYKIYGLRTSNFKYYVVKA
jgi:hypothetical protein